MSDSFVTQCPHCQTSFRVRHAQLGMARGVVRCGACLQVFNAAQQLLNQSPETEQPPALVTPVVAAPEVIEPAPVQAPATPLPASPAPWPAPRPAPGDSGESRGFAVEFPCPGRVPLLG